MKTKHLTNPFILFVAVWLAVFFVYSLRWSSATPAITTAMIVFFCFTLLLSFLFSKVAKVNKQKLMFVEKDDKATIIVLVICFLYGIEFVHYGSIPLLDMIRGISNTGYTEFGIPFVHVLIHTFTSFYLVFLFHKGLVCRKAKYFIFALILLLPQILIFSRGNLIMSFVIIVFCFLNYKEKVKKRTIIIIVVLTLISLYIFGWQGNLRSFNGNKEMFLNQSQATDEFKNGIIPYEFFWTYAYASLPFGTFLLNTIEAIPLGGIGGFVKFIDLCILPDFITNRITLSLLENPTPIFLFNYFNVFSVFTDAYLCLGWFGVILLFLIQSTITLIYIKLLKKYAGQYFNAGISILATVIIFNIFVNMWTFSALSFQLVYPIILGFMKKRKTMKEA